MFAYILGIISGATATVQSSINARVRQDFNSTYYATVINFIVAIVILAALSFAVEGDLILPLARIAEYPVWIWTGGLCGLIIVVFGTICTPVLGSARNMTLCCTGQILTGLIIDHFGLFQTQVTKISMARAAGALLVLIGIILISHEKKEESRAGAKGLWLFMVLAVINGASCAVQVAVNGTLKTVTGSVIKTTFISVSVGFIAAAVFILAVVALKGKSVIYESGGRPAGARFRPYMLLGGIMAVVIVGSNAVTGPILGTGLVTIMNLLGVMAAGLIIDATGFLGIAKKPVTLKKAAGMAVMMAGTVMISLL